MLREEERTKADGEVMVAANHTQHRGSSHSNAQRRTKVEVATLVTTQNECASSSRRCHLTPGGALRTTVPAGTETETETETVRLAERATVVAAGSEVTVATVPMARRAGAAARCRLDLTMTRHGDEMKIGSRRTSRRRHRSS